MHMQTASCQKERNKKKSVLLNEKTGFQDIKKKVNPQILPQKENWVKVFLYA